MFAGMEWVSDAARLSSRPSLATVQLESLSLVPLYSEVDYRVLSTVPTGCDGVHL